MTDLACTWLGLPLRSPIVVGASPLTDDLPALLECAEGGAGAVVMRSLFEEQLVAEQLAAHHYIDSRIDMDAEARTFLPDSDVFGLGAAPYLARLKKLCHALDVPVVASLNGTSPGGWTTYARELADAGASAIEINLYDIVTDATDTGAIVEERQLEVVHAVTQCVSVPVSVKLSLFYSSLPAFVRQLEQAGAKGVVLFNRFYQPDIDLDTLSLSRQLRLSTNAELPLRLHGLAILHGRAALDLASSGGVHDGEDAAKALLCGASAVQVVSALLRHGPKAVTTIVTGLQARLKGMGYRSVAEATGVLSMKNAGNAHHWERLNYAKMLQGWEPARSR